MLPKIMESTRNETKWAAIHQKPLTINCKRSLAGDTEQENDKHCINGHRSDFVTISLCFVSGSAPFDNDFRVGE
jgi:hypothetical protein